MPRRDKPGVARGPGAATLRNSLHATWCACSGLSRGRLFASISCSNRLNLPAYYCLTCELGTNLQRVNNGKGNADVNCKRSLWASSKTLKTCCAWPWRSRVVTTACGKSSRASVRTSSKGPLVILAPPSADVQKMLTRILPKVLLATAKK